MIFDNLWYVGYIVIICCILYFGIFMYNYINHKNDNDNDNDNIDYSNDIINNNLKVLSALNRKNNKIIININGSHYYY